MITKKFALIHMGSDIIYSLEFVATEISRQGHQFQWFDGDNNEVNKQIAAYSPDFICFSPLTTFYNRCRELSLLFKNKNPQVLSVFGGCHVTAIPESVDDPGVDIVIVGPIYGTIENIVKSNGHEIIQGHPVPPYEMWPSAREYFTAITRIGKRHRKPIMSHFGCEYNCSYCSTSSVRKRVGISTYKKFYLARRPIEDLIQEAKIFLEFNTLEVSLEDDDILCGSDIDDWLSRFAEIWKREINLPLYGYVTPASVVRVSDKTMQVLANLVGSVAMGVQAARPESLKLFNRAFQKEEQVKAAYDRLRQFGIPVKLEAIIGLPVNDPIADALETIKQLQRVGPGSFSTAFPLMIYPGTALYDWCKERNIPMNDACNFDWYRGVGSVRFDEHTNNLLQTLSKLSTFFIKYNVNERWIRSIIELNTTPASSKAISESNYLESLMFRQGEITPEKFDEILKETHISY